MPELSFLRLRRGRCSRLYPHNADGRSVGNEANGNYRWYDYCNNPVDAWPIIDDNEIALIPSNDFGWVAISGLMLNGCSSYIDQRLDGCFQHSDTNPLRAAMIVFLMMQDANNA
nr:phage protein NinX family protein [Escherichia coli]